MAFRSRRVTKRSRRRSRSQRRKRRCEKKGTYYNKKEKKCLKSVKLKKGTLGGYKAKMSTKERRKFIDKAVKKLGFNTVSKKLTILSTLLKNNSPKLSKRIKSDRLYAKKKFSKRKTTKKN